MAIRSSQTDYGTLSRALHWVSALLVVSLIPLGLAMTRINEGDNTTMYRIHIALGLMVAVLTLVRVVWRLVEPTPNPPPMPGWRRLAFLANHYAFYVGLFALAVTGIVTLTSNGLTPLPGSVVAGEVEPVPAGGAHFLLTLVFVGLFIMHLVGVLSYQLRKGDVLGKMGLHVGRSATRRDGNGVE